MAPSTGLRRTNDCHHLQGRVLVLARFLFDRITYRVHQHVSSQQRVYERSGIACLWRLKNKFSKYLSGRTVHRKFSSYEVIVCFDYTVYS